MKSITKLYQTALEAKARRGWDRIYIAIDIHETMMEPTYSPEKSTQYYDWCLETLQLLSRDPEVCLILYTCSSVQHGHEYVEEFEGYGVRFDYINENPECTNTDYACFDKKFYMNMILDDKAGFEPEVDWQEFYSILKANKKINYKL